MRQLQPVNSIFFNKSLKKNYIVRRRKKGIYDPAVYSNGITTNTIKPLSYNTGKVQLMSNNQYSNLYIGGTKGTTHNGPIKLLNVGSPSTMFQIGYTVDAIPKSSYSPDSNPYSNTMINGDIKYPTSSFTPGNYLVCINGFVRPSNSNDNIQITLQVGLLLTSSSTGYYTDYTCVDAPFINVNYTCDKCEQISASKVITITSAHLASYPYIAPAIIMISDDVKPSIMNEFTSFSITRIA
jgi:hypothetical protein